MTPHQYNYIFGPLYSWRLGMSLGIDPISSVDKICNFDCIYCQLGRTLHFQNERKIFVPTREILKEVQSFPETQVDYYTFSGKGETTLAKNLGEMIEGVRGMGRGKIAVITNGSLLDRESVRTDLLGADLVMTKLEAVDLMSLKDVNAPVADISFKSIFEGLLKFRSDFKGQLNLQIMFVEQNKKFAAEIAALVAKVKADEVHLNTPLRPSGVDPLKKEELATLKQHFKGMKVFSVYDKEKRDFKPLNAADTIERHGSYQNGKDLDKLDN